MTGSLFSKQWYRVGKLQPQIKNHVVVRRHYYRSALWYVIGTKTNQTNIRVNHAAYYLFRQLNGQRTVDEIWQASLAALGDDAPSQDEVVALLGELFDATILDVQQQSDVDQLFDNHRSKQARAAQSRHWNPLFMRFGLFDPDLLIQRLLPLFGGLFNRVVGYCWLALCVVALVVAAYAWPQISFALSDDLTSTRNLIIIWFVFPVMKLLHELAHGLAVRRWGGEVHEFGVALLVLLPVPYVDASASAGFANKYRRMAVAGAGIIVESALACLSLFLWLLVEPGLVRDIAFNVMLTGSVSCLLFNGNPLLKFDSYYVLSDAVEIPGLASRSTRYLGYLLQRYGFGLDTKTPVTAAGEARWFVAYGVISAIYRLTLTFGICLFVASQYFFIGVALAIWAFCVQILLPVGKGLYFLAMDERLGERRLRANALVGTAAAFVLMLVGFVQVPHVTQARGVIWPMDDAMVRAATDCLVVEVLVGNGQAVTAGESLLRCDTTFLQSEVVQLRAELVAARAQMHATRDRAERGVLKHSVRVAEELLALAEQKLSKAVITSLTDGSLHIPGAHSLLGRYFQQGDLVGYMLSPDNVSIRTMLAQERIALLADELDQVDVLRLTRPRAVSSKVIRTVPAATEVLVSPVLGTVGGGDLPVRADDGQTPRLAEAAFEIEIALPEPFRNALVGEVFQVRFDHGDASLAKQLYGKIQLLLLRRFSV